MAGTLIAMERLETLLKQANGRRRERVISMKDVLGCISMVQEWAIYATTNGGDVAASYDYRAVTTLVLVARVNEMIHVGITVADARSVSPGRAWSCLQPWKGGVSNAKKWQQWITDSEVIRLEHAEVDALLEL